MDFTKLAYKVCHNDFLKITTENIIIPSLFLSTFYFLFPPPSPKVKKKSTVFWRWRPLELCSLYLCPFKINNTQIKLNSIPIFNFKTFYWTSNRRNTLLDIIKNNLFQMLIYHFNTAWWHNGDSPISIWNKMRIFCYHHKFCIFSWAF